MRVALLHNTSAGSKEHTADELVSTVREEGHDVITVAHSLAELLPALQAKPLDLIVVAGGDGTVGRAACALVGSSVPLAILPLGTANNTALALGIHGSVRELVRGWKRGRVEQFDIGTARVGPELLRFGEAAGWGIFPDVIREAKQGAPAERERTVHGERELFRAVAERAQPRRYVIDADGQDFSGEYLLVEIMNLPFVGPQLLLSPMSDPKDRLLELVLVKGSELGELLELVENESKAPASALPFQRAKRVSVRSSDARLHIDGRLVAGAGVADAMREVRLEVGALPVSYLLNRELSLGAVAGCGFARSKPVDARR